MSQIDDLLSRLPQVSGRPPTIDEIDWDYFYATAFGPDWEEFKKITEPRRYHSPGGYYAVKHFTRKIRCALAAGTIGILRNRTLAPSDAWDYGCAQLQLKHGLPVYYISRNLLDALSKTEPPPNLLLSQLRFPMPAATFMLPEKYIAAPSGQCLVSVSYARHHRDIPIKAHAILPQITAADTESEINEGFLYAACTEDGETYNGWVPIDSEQDYAGIMRTIREKEFRYANATTVIPGDKEFGDTMVNFILRLIMVMGARPQYIEHGKLTQRARMKRGELVTEVWSPNWIGEKYRMARKAHQGGTHSGPEVHTRMGHWRNQQFGPRKDVPEELLQYKMIWIEPMVVGGAE